MAETITHMMGEVETIALATDGSTFSNSAVQEAIFWGQSRDRKGDRSSPLCCSACGKTKE